MIRVTRSGHPQRQPTAPLKRNSLFKLNFARVPFSSLIRRNYAAIIDQLDPAERKLRKRPTRDLNRVWTI
jgi:hypothetical protein